MEITAERHRTSALLLLDWLTDRTNELPLHIRLVVDERLLRMTACTEERTALFLALVDDTVALISARTEEVLPTALAELMIA